MRSWLIAVAAFGLAVTVALAPAARHRIRAQTAVGDAPALAKVTSLSGAVEPAPLSPPALAGLDLTRIGLDDDGPTAPSAAGRVARLTLDPDLQRTAMAILNAQHLPEAAIVMLDPATGQVLVYANHVEHGPHRDLSAEATAPAASVFKIVTGAALIEEAGLTPDTRQCYSGGGAQKILASDLVDNPQRDRYCVTLAGAMGRSVNTVFARLAQKHLTPELLVERAKSFGFEDSVPFDAPIAPSTIRVPPDALGFARTAAGFWNTTLSPMHAAWISAAVARGGEGVRPTIVRDIKDKGGAVVYTSPPSPAMHRLVTPETAQALTTMMEHTVNEGTSFRAFHDARGTPFLPGMQVAGKTGTLSDDHAGRFYTWFTGFAPSRPVAGVRPVVIAVLVVNEPTWRVKANVVARWMLTAHFAAARVPGVSRPAITQMPPLTLTDE